MAMTRKRRRLIIVVTGMAILGLAVTLVLNAFEDNLVFFYSPTDIVEKQVAPGKRVRIGGLVEDGSVEKEAGGTTVHFRITDGANVLTVEYSGILPDLFREGQGVVAEGRLTPPVDLSLTACSPNMTRNTCRRKLPRP